MKTKFKSLIAMFAITFSLSAQKGYVSAVDYELTLPSPNLEEALVKITAAESNEKTINYPKTYIVKQRVYKAMYNKDKANNDNLFLAYDAVKKAEELDIKGDEKGKGIGKFKAEIKKDLIMLRVDFQNCGAAAYNEKNYDLAMRCFEKTLEIDQMPSFIEKGSQATLDTALLFNTAICAYYSKNMPKTEQYMLQCIEYNYGDLTPHTVMYLQYKEKEDTVNMVSILKDGFEKHPNDATFLRELVIYYISVNDIEEGMKYINIALEDDPENSSFWFTKGTFYDQVKDNENAIVAYNTAISTAKTADERYNANYNLAVIFYNNAVEAANKANEIGFDDQTKYNELAAVAKKKFYDCIPYFEACLADKPDDIETLKALRPVYYRLSEDVEIQKKYDALQAKIKSLE